MKEIVETIAEQKAIVIIRNFSEDEILKLAEILHRGGLNLFEITYNHNNSGNLQETPKLIESLKKNFGNEIRVGAGTVLSEEEVLMTKQAGGEYIISPNTDRSVIELTKKMGMASIPGAFTPSEIVKANEYGADFVKIFPINFAGSRYIKDIRAPISHISLIATGGVNGDNFSEWLACGCIGAGIGSWLANKSLLHNGGTEELLTRARKISSIAKNA